MTGEAFARQLVAMVEAQVARLMAAGLSRVVAEAYVDGAIAASAMSEARLSRVIEYAVDKKLGLLLEDRRPS